VRDEFAFAVRCWKDNARSILKHYRVEGEALWSRFNGGEEGTLWYYRALVEAFRSIENDELIDELDRVVREIEISANKTTNRAL
jgi:hypothetical protein